MKLKGYSVPRAALSDVEAPIQTNTYKPVLHNQIIDATLEAIDKKGWTITDEIYKSGRQGKQVTGEYRFTADDAEIGMSIMFQNSYDKTMTLKYVSGYHTFVCSNGQLYGDVGQFKKKHVSDVQVIAPLEIALQLESVEAEFEKAIAIKNRLKEMELTKKTCAQLIGQLFIEESLLNVTQLGIIKREIEIPSFDYGVENTMWNLYSNITHSYKELAPFNYIGQATRLAQFIESY